MGGSVLPRRGAAYIESGPAVRGRTTPVPYATFNPRGARRSRSGSRSHPACGLPAGDDAVHEAPAGGPSLEALEQGVQIARCGPSATTRTLPSISLATNPSRSSQDASRRTANTRKPTPCTLPRTTASSRSRAVPARSPGAPSRDLPAPARNDDVQHKSPGSRSRRAEDRRAASRDRTSAAEAGRPTARRSRRPTLNERRLVDDVWIAQLRNGDAAHVPPDVEQDAASARRRSAADPRRRGRCLLRPRRRHRWPWGGGRRGAAGPAVTFRGTGASPRPRPVPARARRAGRRRGRAARARRSAAPPALRERGRSGSATARRGSLERIAGAGIGHGEARPAAGEPGDSRRDGRIDAGGLGQQLLRRSRRVTGPSRILAAHGPDGRQQQIVLVGRAA